MNLLVSHDLSLYDNENLFAWYFIPEILLVCFHSWKMNLKNEHDFNVQRSMDQMKNYTLFHPVKSYNLVDWEFDRKKIVSGWFLMFSKVGWI